MLERSSTVLRNKLQQELTDGLQQPIFGEFQSILQQHKDVTNSRIVKELNALCQGSVDLPQSKDQFINLSYHELSADQLAHLRLGTNCHIQSKNVNIIKATKLELLHSSL